MHVVRDPLNTCHVLVLSSSDDAEPDVSTTIARSSIVLSIASTSRGQFHCPRGLVGWINGTAAVDGAQLTCTGSAPLWTAVKPSSHRCPPASTSILVRPPCRHLLIYTSSTIEATNEVRSSEGQSRSGQPPLPNKLALVHPSHSIHPHSLTEHIASHTPLISPTTTLHFTSQLTHITTTLLSLIMVITRSSTANTRPRLQPATMNNINPSSSPSIEAPHRHSQHNNTVPVILNHDTRLVNRASNLYTRAFKELLTSSRVIMNDIDRLISHHVDHHQTHCAPEVVKALALAEMVVVSTGVSVEATQQSLGNVVSWALHQRSDEVRVLAEQMINDATLLLVKFLREEQQEEEVKAMEVDGEEGVVDQLDLDDVYKHRPVAPPTPAGARPSIVFGVDPNQARNKVAVDYLTVVDYVRTQQTWLDSQRRPPPSTLPAPRLVDVESHPGHSTVNLQSVEAAYPQAVRCGPDSLYIPLFFTGDVANTLLIGLQGELVYVPRDDPRLQFKIFNRINQLPRDKSFLGDVNGDVAPQYRYNPPGSTLYPEVQPWGRTTGHIHQQLALIQFTCHLVANRYRNGADHIGFHHDKTRDFVLGSSVLTVSFGSTRRFELKLLDEKDKKERIKLLLEHGSLFILGPLTNAQYKHSIVQETSKKTDVGGAHQPHLPQHLALHQPDDPGGGRDPTRSSPRERGAQPWRGGCLLLDCYGPPPHERRVEPRTWVGPSSSGPVHPSAYR